MVETFNPLREVYKQCMRSPWPHSSPWPPIERRHGPYAPCPRSPNGEHCWHLVGFRKKCCYCGAEK